MPCGGKDANKAFLGSEPLQKVAKVSAGDVLPIDRLYRNVVEGRGQDGRALRRSFLRSALARRSDLWPARGRPGGFPRCVRLSPGVLDVAVPVGVGLCRVGRRSEARPGSQGAPAVRPGALPRQRDGPSTGGPLESGLRGLRAEEPSWGPLMTEVSCGAWHRMFVVPEQ
ncbi:hypothetical protein NDU88_007976 [Pleurodeles waltl]|uniref:Uncharacterized protein n=1 Tax=Pleurodeles waltl TaxID=8319 RepID=A0AAV7PQU5_PLEWA|nr:hypothetical protein NDU88_007976 [Pleurodeles waltl]